MLVYVAPSGLGIIISNIALNVLVALSTRTACHSDVGLSAAVEGISAIRSTKIFTHHVSCELEGLGLQPILFYFLFSVF
jgi:hypothetical protein